MPTVESIISTIPMWTSAGIGGGAGFFAIKWFVEWLSGRVDKRETAVEVSRAQVDAAMQDLIAHLQQQIADLAQQNKNLTQRVDAVEAELDNCRAERAADQKELARLQGAILGMGDAKQKAAAILAAERVQDRDVAKIVRKIGEAK